MSSVHTLRRTIAVLVAVTCGAPAAVSAAPADGHVRTAPERRAAAAVPGVPRTWMSPESGAMPSVSADGRMVAYVADPPDARTSTVLVLDRELAVTSDALAWSSDVVGEVVRPVLSGDGCTLTAITELPLDRFRDDDRGVRWDVYQRRLSHCAGDDTWRLVSEWAGSARGDVDPTHSPAVSFDGRTVAFARRITTAERAVIDDSLAADATTVSVVTLTGGRPAGERSVSVDDVTMVASEPSLSDDGTIMAFTTSNIDGTDRHVAVWRLSDADPVSTAERVGGAGASWSPSLSGDGSRVAFVSTTAGLEPTAVLPPCSVQCVPQVYVVDLTTGRARLASRVGRGEGIVAGNGPASSPVLDRSGTEVVYVSRATNLFTRRHRSVGGVGDGEIVRHRIGSRFVERVSVGPDGFEPTAAVHAHPAISGDARVVVFDSAMGPGRAGSFRRSISLVAVDPVLTLTDLDVGEVRVGFPSIARRLTLTNHGPSVFDPTVVEVDGIDFAVQGGTCTEGAAVPPGGSCSVEVIFFPGSPGAKQARLTVREEGFEAVSVQSTLVGVGGDPRISVEPVLFEAPTAQVGTAGAIGTFFLQTVNGRRTKVTSVALGGAAPLDFIVYADECTGETLTTGEVCSVVVVFRPTAAGRRTATLTLVSSNGGRATVTLAGDGVYRPALQLRRGAVGSGGVVRVASPSRIRVAGNGFAPGVPVVIAWADGFGRPVTVTTGANGAFATWILVLPGQPLGRRILVASALGSSAALAMTVVPRPD